MQTHHARQMTRQAQLATDAARVLPEVAGINFYLADTYDGNAAVFVQVLLTDASVTKDLLGPTTRHIQTFILERLDNVELGYYSYFTWRSVSEQRQLKDSNWPDPDALPTQPLTAFPPTPPPSIPLAGMPFNINHDIYIRPTPEGFRLLGHHGSNPNAEGWVRMQFWRFMEIVGPHMHIGVGGPIETTVRFEMEPTPVPVSPSPLHVFAIRGLNTGVVYARVAETDGAKAVAYARATCNIPYDEEVCAEVFHSPGTADSEYCNFCNLDRRYWDAIPKCPGQSC